LFAAIANNLRIINTASTVAFRGAADMVEYAASKGAIACFMRSLAKQLTSKGIRVNAVAPGPVYTTLEPAPRLPGQMDVFGKESMLGRPGQPSEIAPSFVLLACKEATFYHSQIFACLSAW
jgi:NAD(P)-dependent dehydrogenase (short-subunit alcohol dehydrogenase family)